jgi:hypothetical protein
VAGPHLPPSLKTRKTRVRRTTRKTVVPLKLVPVPYTMYLYVKESGHGRMFTSGNIRTPRACPRMWQGVAVLRPSFKGW